MMFEQWPDYKAYLTSLIYVICGLSARVVFDRVVLRLLQRLTSKTNWVGDEIFLNGLRDVVVLWFLLAGVAAALITMQISPTALRVAHKTLS